jgi:hypothetical protein
LDVGRDKPTDAPKIPFEMPKASHTCLHNKTRDDLVLFYRRSEFGTSLVLRGRDAACLAAGTGEVIALVKSLGGTPVEEWLHAPTLSLTPLRRWGGEVG